MISGTMLCRGNKVLSARKASRNGRQPSARNPRRQQPLLLVVGPSDFWEVPFFLRWTTSWEQSEVVSAAACRLDLGFTCVRSRLITRYWNQRSAYISQVSSYLYLLSG